MRTINGKHNFAHVMIDDLEESTVEQIESFLNCPVFKGSQIRIMADCHAGAGAVIGFTATTGEHVIPNVVGVDLSCGVESYCLGKIDIDFPSLDAFIRENIPSGFSVREKPSEEILSHKETIDLVGLVCDKTNQDFDRVKRSLGTLGGGNHAIEVGKDEDGVSWLMIHTGSRNFGLKIANYHQKKAKELMKTFMVDSIKDLEFLPMEYGGKEYLTDTLIAQRYAELNRHVIAKTIIEGFFRIDLDTVEAIKTIHNYIDQRYDMIRKGAISARKGERVVIPLNMRDGFLIGVGKGSKKWNNSAPHGAGRVMGRKEAHRRLKLEDFQDTMKGVWSSCISEKTLDEAPMVYKDAAMIIAAIGETVEVTSQVKPVYNFKATD